MPLAPSCRKKQVQKTQTRTDPRSEKAPESKRKAVTFFLASIGQRVVRSRGIWPHRIGQIKDHPLTLTPTPEEEGLPTPSFFWRQQL